MEACEGGNVKESASGAIDDLFAQIRLNLLKLRDSDPVATEDIKNLLTQLEDWVEKLVIDSLKLESASKSPKKTAQPKKKP